MNKYCATCDRVYLDGKEFCSFDGTALSNVVNECEEQKLVGETIGGKYLLTKFLGKDYQGDIYLAHHTHMGEPVLVKMMTHPDFSQPWQLELMRRDLQLVMLVQHSNVIRIFDFGVTNSNIAYIVTEKTSGISLSEILKKKALSINEVIDILEPVCSALAEAHKRNIITRLLSPDNITVELVDGKIEKQKVKLSLPIGLVANNPAYVSPEQAQGLELTSRSNIYSLGVILYQALTGRLPFTDESVASLQFKHIYNIPCPPQELDPKIPFAVSVTILKALAKRPQDRQSNILELVQDMSQALETPSLSAQKEIVTELRSIAQAEINTKKDLPTIKDPIVSTAEPNRKKWFSIKLAKLRYPTTFWKIALNLYKKYFAQVTTQKVR